ncbi:MAG: aldolase [Peptococcaceae bacterium BRH_c4b]|nr:MAG: aldolase [Peptococcaceae bacterium BRH_c4b]
MITVAAEKAKDQILKIGTRMSSAGLVVGTWGNISQRVRKENLMVITPSGIPYSCLRIADIVVVDIEGQVLEGERRPSSEYMMHLEIYKKRSDVDAIVHTHSIYASSLAVAREPIPPILEDMAQLVGSGVPVAGYARAGTMEMALKAAEGISHSNAVLLANHGVVGVGRSLDEALMVCQIVEKAAQIYILSKLAGSPHVLPDVEVKELRKSFLEDYGQKGCPAPPKNGR